MAKDYESTNATTYLSLSLLSLLGNTSARLSKTMTTFKWFAVFSALVLIASLTTAIIEFFSSLPDFSHIIHLEVHKWVLGVGNCALAVVFIVIWIGLCCSRTAYNLMSSYNRAVIVSTLFAYAMFAALTTARLFLFDNFYGVDYVTKAQLLVDLQMSLSWSATLSLVYILGFVVSIFSILCLTVSVCPEVAVIKHSSTSVKDMINSAAAQ